MTSVGIMTCSGTRCLPVDINKVCSRSLGSVLQHSQQVVSDSVSDDLSSEVRVFFIRFCVRLSQSICRRSHFNVPLGKETVSPILTDVVQNAAGGDDSGHHRDVDVALFQQAPPASLQSGESSVDHRAGRGEGVGEATLLRRQPVLPVVSFHQPRLQRERRVTDEVGGDFHSVRYG